MAKNLIISGFSGYNYNQLKPYLKSIDENVGDCDKVMITGNASSETIGKLIEHGWFIEKLPEMNVPIHVARFLAIYEFLRERYQDYKWVVSTDVKDVIFQCCPFEWLESESQNQFFKLVAGSESMRYKDEPWGNENLMQAYGPFVHERFKDNLIFNVGTLGGEAEYIKDLVFQIFFNGINRPIPIVDQAVYNVLLQTQPYKGITFFANQSHGWACQAGTTVDPSKIEKFRPFLTESEPVWKDGCVLTATGQPFTIVHQYDRVPEWKKYYMEKYEQEDESQYFTYRI
jgi:hypothetical protein